MRLSTFGLVGLASCVVAREQSTQDMIAMQQTFDKIFTGIDKAVLDIREFKGDAAGIETIQKDFAAVQAAIQEGTTKVKASPAMGIPDILTIFGPVGVMESQVGEVVDELIKKKDQITAANGVDAVKEELTKSRVAADALITAILAGLPLSGITSLVGGPVAKTITDRLDGGIRAFGGTIPTAKAAAPKAAAPKAAGKGGLGGLFGGKGKGKGKGGAAIPAQVGAAGKLRKRQNAIGNLVASTINPKGGKVKDPAGAAPRRVEIASRVPQIPGSKTVKMRYGPYKVPSMAYKNVLGEEGALWNYADNVVEKPCTECTIVGMVAGLEYPDGKSANIDTQLWLHHMVLLNVGPGRVDATCGKSLFSLPHMVVGSSATGSERLFSSGNERTPAILPSWNETNVGYKLKTADKFALIVDLMNESMDKEQVAYLTITYDFVPGHPADYDDMKPIWFDVAQCLTSEWPAPYQEGKYTIPSTIWTADIDGDIVGAAGHLHDGGQAVVLEVDGKVACRSEASYGGSPQYIGKSHGGGATEHLSKMSICIGPTLIQKKMVKGQKWKLRAEYDYTKNKGSHHGDGKQSNVMGISIMYVRVKK